MNEKILIKGLEQGPPQKPFGDWSFRRLWRKANASELRLAHDKGRRDLEHPRPSAGGSPAVEDDD